MMIKNILYSAPGDYIYTMLEFEVNSKAGITVSVAAYHEILTILIIDLKITTLHKMLRTMHHIMKLNV